MAKQQEPERKIFVTISDGNKRERFETWRYWEIVGALQWMGADRQTAYDAAKWAGRATPGDWYKIALAVEERDPYTMDLHRQEIGEIKMEVKGEP